MRVRARVREALQHPALELSTHARGRHPAQAVDLVRMRVRVRVRVTLP